MDMVDEKDRLCEGRDAISVDTGVGETVDLCGRGGGGMEELALAGVGETFRDVDGSSSTCVAA